MSASDPLWQSTTFTKLSNTTLYSPPALPNPISTSGPHTIILCSWMNASPKHILKYTLLYQTLFPNAAILLITTTSRQLLNTLAKTQAELKDAVGLIHNGEGEGEVMVAIYSNGGSYAFGALALAYRQKYGELLAVKAMVMDSTPSPENSTFYYDVWKARLAFGAALPKNLLLRYIGMSVILSILSLAYFIRVITRSTPFITVVRQRLNDPKLVPLGRRTYIYSKTDKLIEWQHVNSHAQEAEEKGWKVERVLFEEADHVDHLRRHPKEYTEAVKRVWKERQ